MSPGVARCTNISPSKRSFEETAFPRPNYAQYYNAHYAIAPRDKSPRHVYPQPYPPSKRRSSFTRSSTMIAGGNTVMSGSFPSFMSVFGSEESEVYRPVELDDQSKTNQDAFMLMTAQPQSSLASQHHSKPFHHRGSINSSFSESTESSPTTTNSTFDSPLVSDTSASASPESASSCAPPSSFRPVFAPKKDLPVDGPDDKPSPANTATSHTMQDAAKNVKKLTLDMDLTAIRRPATSHGPEVTQPFSAPTSPSKEPLRSARKKPTNLTIRTPGYNQLTFPKVAGSNVPATPNQRLALHQYQSSPALSSLASPRAGPAGGMFLPLPSLNTNHSKANSSSSNGSSFASSMPDLQEENEPQVLRSQEAPERGYTDGPVCIYDCGVYLYLEPTAEEARQFDTVINVAKEVRNPLRSQKPGEDTVMSVWRSEPSQNRRSVISEPQTAVSEFSFKSAWEWQPQNTTTPTATTPTQSTFASKPTDPEYVHVRWDHNSEILEDLYPLCSMIDDRVAQGKKVLIHCQLGVSRSASLIIAYGLYKDYQPNFHSMYTAVKERSRWVGPNMSLIYQLTDFKGKLNKGEYANCVAQPKSDWFVRSPDGPVIAATPESAPAGSIEVPAVEEIGTAISTPGLEKRPAPVRLSRALPPVPAFPQDDKPATRPFDGPRLIGLPTPQKKPGATVKRAASRPLPFRERNMDMSIPEHRPRGMPGITLPQSSAIMDLAMNDVPSTPSLFSPRATEFMATPFGIRGAGDLSTPGNRQSTEMPQSFSWLPLRKDGHVRTASKDPRSPHHNDEPAEMFRNIDHFLQR